MAAGTILSANDDHVFMRCFFLFFILRFGSNLRSILLRENVRFYKFQMLSKKPCDKTNQKCCNNSTFPHTIQSARKNKGKCTCNHSHGRIKDNLCCSKIRIPCLYNGTDKRLARQHDHIGQHLQIYTKSKHDASCKKCNQLYHIIFWIYPEEQIHGKINKISKCNGYWNLENILHLKIIS